MRKYLNPEIRIEMLDIEDVITTSGGVESKSAVAVATEALKAQNAEIEILTMG